MWYGRTLVPLAVRTCLVALELDQVLERRAVLLSAIGRGIGPPRHVVAWDVVVVVACVRRGGRRCAIATRRVRVQCRRGHTAMYIPRTGVKRGLLALRTWGLCFVPELTFSVAG